MVECEFVKRLFIFNYLLVLIDTWWNVNNTDAIVLPQESRVLIDTWWNVNSE